jgi:hypothetical protein
LEDINKRTFDMFKFTAAVGREKTLPIIAMNLIF